MQVFRHEHAQVKGQNINNKRLIFINYPEVDP